MKNLFLYFLKISSVSSGDALQVPCWCTKCTKIVKQWYNKGTWQVLTCDVIRNQRISLKDYFIQGLYGASKCPSENAKILRLVMYLREKT